MSSVLPPLLILHVAFGFAAVVVGLLPLMTRKGSRPHRWSGRLFVGLMIVLLAAAWAMTAIRFTPYLFALTATASFHVFSGVRVLKRKRPDLMASQRARPLDWLAAVGVIAAGLLVLGMVGFGGSDGPVVLSAGLAGAALAYGGWDLWRFARPGDWPFSPNLWTYEHLAKMLSAYSAVLSAFSGNFLTFLPAPWSQLWPSLLFPSLAAIWIGRLVLARRPFVTA